MEGAVIKIPAELFALAESSHFEGALRIPKIEIGPDDYAFSEPVSWNVDVTNTGAALLVNGRAKGVATVSCSRCLDEVACEFDGSIEGYYLIEGSNVSDFSEGEEELGEDEFDVLPSDHLIDLEPLICAALMVDAPNMPLCREDCAGLCPTCGANLNKEDCGCERDAGLDEFDREANPFSVLADFKFDD